MFPIFIVHLEHEVDKRKQLEEQLQREQLTYEFVRAVDGQNGDLELHSFSVLPQWTEPFTRKPMTKGEIGCALSHHSLWKRIVDEQLAYTLILEDDAVLCPSFAESLKAQLASAPEYDILYVGRRPLREEDDTPFHPVKYSYGTHAYMLSYQGAKKLMDGGFLNHLIPVDEYLPLMYDPDYPHVEYIPFFNKMQVNAYSVSPLLVHTLEGDSYKSTTYHSDPYPCSLVDSYIVISVGTSPNDALSRFEHSCRSYGHPYKILGRNTVWEGGNMKGPGGGQKINLFYRELKTWTEAELERIVLFTDSYDVMFVTNPKEILQKYEGNILFSCETSCWPDPSLASLYPSPHYLNSGGFIGKGKDLLSILQEVPPESDDQLYYTHKFLSTPGIQLDIQSKIFQTLNSNTVEIIPNGRVKNALHQPCLLHGNGPPSVKRYLNSLENYLQGWSSVYKYCITQQSSTPLVYVCSPNMPVLDYPTEQLLYTSISLDSVVQDFLTTSAEYLFIIEPSYHITRPSTLKELLSMKKTIVGPMVKKNEVWSNFWGAISDTGYYQRSFDYLDIVSYQKKAVWNVPYLTGILLLHRSLLEACPDVYAPTDDMDMAFAARVRDANYFMYVSNLHVYGYIEDDSLTNVHHPSWEKLYIHPDYLRYRDSLSELCTEPCSNVFCFPLFTTAFCQKLIDLCESSNQWSSGRSDVIDTRLNAYENVPTRDIHLHQLQLDNLWNYIVTTYISPVTYTVFHKYKTKKINISFVVKYSMEGQRELTPHHDASTYTVNICLNNEFEGGGCYFIPQQHFLEHKQIGHVSMHPGRLTHYHEGRPITSGTRYILVSFIE
jgi:procollagen-lysine,2-oxoglutarate 5-dioxygenase